MSASEIERTLVRLVHEIIEKNNGADRPWAGRHPAARRAAGPAPGADDRAHREDAGSGRALWTSLCIATTSPLWVRNRWCRRPRVGFPITGKNIILVDDVLYTGRTIRAAMDALFREGRPKQVQLCVLIDRGHRELPIEAGFIGRKVQTTDREIIEVKLREVDDAEKVLLVERQD